jgi:hypothetical protein
MVFLNDPRLNFLPSVDRSFVFQFDNAMRDLGYDHGDVIGSGHCWRKYRLIYRLEKQAGICADLPAREWRGAQVIPEQYRQASCFP